jgi:hypothetical protein
MRASSERRQAGWTRPLVSLKSADEGGGSAPRPRSRQFDGSPRERPSSPRQQTPRADHSAEPTSSATELEARSQRPAPAPFGFMSAIVVEQHARAIERQMTAAAHRDERSD